MGTLHSTVAAEIAAVLGRAKSTGYTARSVLVVARYRLAVAAGRKPRTPSGAVTRLYLDALDGKVKGGGVALAALRQMVERLETLLCQQVDEDVRPTLVGDNIPEGDDILLCDIPTVDAAKPLSKRVVRLGSIRVRGDIYCHAALRSWHGQTVQVVEDDKSGATVWVRDLRGHPICAAERQRIVPLAPMGATPVTVLEVVALDVEVAGPGGKPVRPVMVIALDPDGRLAQAAGGTAQVARLMGLAPHRHRFPVQAGPGRLERAIGKNADALLAIATATAATLDGR